jgi:hypothetical protein
MRPQKKTKTKKQWIGLVLLLKGIGERFRSIEVEAMLSPTEIATIRAELQRLENARRGCTDTGLRK